MADPGVYTPGPLLRTVPHPPCSLRSLPPPPGGFLSARSSPIYYIN